jgi:hypothetical protein
MNILGLKILIFQLILSSFYTGFIEIRRLRQKIGFVGGLRLAVAAVTGYAERGRVSNDDRQENG